jgi:hypothetical protein
MAKSSYAGPPRQQVGLRNFSDNEIAYMDIMIAYYAFLFKIFFNFRISDQTNIMLSLHKLYVDWHSRRPKKILAKFLFKVVS